jgi:hypothetical protein
LTVNGVTRRDALRLAAAGAAVTVGATAALAQGRPGDSRDKLPPPPPDGAREAARKGVRRLTRPPAPRDASTARLAYVLHCRSWDKHVYLYLDENLKGFVEVDDRAFAIAAACEVASRPVAVKYWGYDPNWSDGSGRFDGVLMAMDERDFP